MSQLSELIDQLYELNNEEIEPEDGSVKDSERYWDDKLDHAEALAAVGFAVAKNVRPLAELTDEIEQALRDGTIDAQLQVLWLVGRALELEF